MIDLRSSLRWVPCLLAAAPLAAAQELRFEPHPYERAAPSTASPYYEFSAEAEEAYAAEHRYDEPKPALPKLKELEIEHLTKEAFLDHFQSDGELRSPNGQWVDLIRSGEPFSELGSSQKQLYAALKTFDRLVAEPGTLNDIYHRWIDDYGARMAALEERTEKANLDWYDGLIEAPLDDPRRLAWAKERNWQDEERRLLRRQKEALRLIFAQERRLQSIARREAREAAKAKERAAREQARLAAKEKREAERRQREEERREEAERRRAEAEARAAKSRAEAAEAVARAKAEAAAAIEAAEANAATIAPRAAAQEGPEGASPEAAETRGGLGCTLAAAPTPGPLAPGLLLALLSLGLVWLRARG